MVFGFAPLWLGPSFRLWSRVRANADVRYRSLEYSGRDSLRSHAWQRRILILAPDSKYYAVIYPSVTLRGFRGVQAPRLLISAPRRNLLGDCRRLKSANARARSPGRRGACAPQS